MQHFREGEVGEGDRHLPNQRRVTRIKGTGRDDRTRDPLEKTQTYEVPTRYLTSLKYKLYNFEWRNTLKERRPTGGVSGLTKW